MRIKSKAIPGFPNYKVINDGRVIGPKGVMVGSGKRYRYVGMKQNGKRVFKKVHRLVAEAFIPNPFNLPEVNHKDLDKYNNREDNLEWMTRQQNMEHAREHGVCWAGPPEAVCVMHKLTGEEIKYPSVYAAAKAIGKHRAIITRMVRKYGVYGKRSCDYLVRRAV